MICFTDWHEAQTNIYKIINLKNINDYFYVEFHHSLELTVGKDLQTLGSSERSPQFRLVYPTKIMNDAPEEYITSGLQIAWPKFIALSEDVLDIVITNNEFANALRQLWQENHVDLIAELNKKLQENDIKLQEKDKKLQENDIKLLEKDMKLQEKDMKLQENDIKFKEIHSISIWQYFERGKSLPPLVKRGTKTGGRPSRNHLPIHQVQEVKFGLLPFEVNERSKLKQTVIFSKETLSYSTEDDVQNYVKTVVEDILFAAELDKVLELTQNLAISELKADFWILFNQMGYPLAAIEVKKPANFNENDKAKLYGQLFDYMMKIRSFYGLSNIFGILTSFEQWEICWLPDSCSAAIATDLNFDLNEVDENAVNQRNIMVSEQFSSSDSCQLATALISLFKKLTRNAQLRYRVPLVSSVRPYIIINKSTWYWKKGINCTSLKFTFSVSNDIWEQDLYLLRDFHGGADGRVWLACTSTGQLLVIKFPKVADDDKNDSSNEVERWTGLGVPAVQRMLMNRQAIIFPFAFHYRETADGIQVDNSWWDDDPDPPIENFNFYRQKACLMNPQGVLVECIRRCADANLIHEDIFWKHVAIFPVNEDVMPCFIDLTRMTSAKDSHACIKAMIEAVRTNLDIHLQIET